MYMPKHESRLALAHKYMVSKHGLQKRKTGEYYTVHPILVAALAMIYKGDSYKIETIQIACLLHDTIEDTDAYYEEIKGLFGEEVADIVLEVTSISKEAMTLQGDSKREYLAKKMTAMTEYGLVVKLLDRLANVMTLKGTKDTFKYRQMTDTDYILAAIYNDRIFKTRTHHIIMEQIQVELDKYNPQKNPLIVPEEVDLGFEFDSLVMALDEKTRLMLTVEIDNISTLLNKVKEANR